jgi:hypothetical protein
VLQKKGNGSAAILYNSLKKWSTAADVGRVYYGSLIKQELEELFLPMLGCPRNSCISKLVTRLDRGSTGEQLFGNADTAAVCRIE